MLAWTVSIMPDQPRLVLHRIPICSLARAAPPYAVDTLRVSHLALSLGCGLGLSVPGMRLIRFVPSPAAALATWVEIFSWLREQGEASMCVLLTHSCTVRTRAAVGRRCTHRLRLRSRAVI
jgi:hypothetical protein